jgi:hypothetical protein
MLGAFFVTHNKILSQQAFARSSSLFLHAALIRKPKHSGKRFLKKTLERTVWERRIHSTPLHFQTSSIIHGNAFFLLGL